MSASDDNAPPGTPRPREEPGAPARDDNPPRTLRSPLPPPPLMPGIVPMPELSQAGAPSAPAQSTAPSPVPDPPPAPFPTTATPPDTSEAPAPPLPPLAPSVGASGGRPEGPGMRTPIASYGQRVERGAWQQREKVEANDPSDDEELLHEEGGDGWAIAGASRIGRSHLHDGKYREDGLAAAITAGGWHLVAVADGGGSYRLARVGAPLAARTAVAAMQAALEGETEKSRRTRSQREAREEEGEERATAEGAEGEGEESRAQAALVAGLRAARRALYDEAERRRAAGDEAVTAADLRTTLLLALHHALADGRQLVAGAQVGDGLIAAREGATGDGMGTLHLLGMAETGAIGNETIFLPDVPDEVDEWIRRVRLARLDGASVHLLVLSDGVSDDFAPAEEHLWRLERPLFTTALASEHTPAEAAVALRDLLGYERAGSFDDRTLVCVYHRSAAP